jgi:hypothetical protein
LLHLIWNKKRKDAITFFVSFAQKFEPLNKVQIKIKLFLLIRSTSFDYGFVWLGIEKEITCKYSHMAMHLEI